MMYMYFCPEDFFFFLANSVDPDKKMLPYVAFHLGLHCLPKYLCLLVSRMKRLKVEQGKTSFCVCDNAFCLRLLFCTQTFTELHKYPSKLYEIQDEIKLQVTTLLNFAFNICFVLL